LTDLLHTVLYSIKFHTYFTLSRRGRDRMVVGFIITYKINAFHC